jgi:hypothetical protein
MLYATSMSTTLLPQSSNTITDIQTLELIQIGDHYDYTF